MMLLYAFLKMASFPQPPTIFCVVEILSGYRKHLQLTIFQFGFIFSIVKVLCLWARMFLPTNTRDMDAKLYCSHHLFKLDAQNYIWDTGLFSFILSESYNEKGTQFS